MADTVMDKVSQAREKAMQRTETIRAKIGAGGSGVQGRLLMGGGGIGSLDKSEVGKRIQGIRASIQTRIKNIRGGKTTGGPLNLLGMGESKVEKPEVKYETKVSSSKVIRV